MFLLALASFDESFLEDGVYKQAVMPFLVWIHALMNPS